MMYYHCDKVGILVSILKILKIRKKIVDKTINIRLIL